jgi:hypothetical protein
VIVTDDDFPVGIVSSKNTFVRWQAERERRKLREREQGAARPPLTQYG